MIEELMWVLLFFACLLVTLVQFKYCVPITLVCLKLLNAVCMLFIIKVYFMFRIEGNTIDWVRIRDDVVNILDKTFDL